jgi:hypothetical protein
MIATQNSPNRHELPVDFSRQSVIDAKIYPISILQSSGAPKTRGRMTMLRKILLLALLLFAPCTSFADDLTCEPKSNGDLTMQQFTDCLLLKHGSEAIVTIGTVVGADSSGNELFADDYVSAVGLLTPICAQPGIYANAAGAFNYIWCSTPTVPRQATRETWHTCCGFPPKLIIFKAYNCSNPQQHAAMPSLVKAAVCP